MKKTRGAAALVLAVLLAVSALALAACGSSQSAAEKDTLSVTSEPTEEQVVEEEPVVLPTKPFYVMVVGSDSREGTVGKHGQYADGKGRSDTLMLVRVDPKKYKLTIVTVPRDTQAEYDGERVKINETFHRGGVEALRDAVKDLTGVEADHYLVTTFVGFEELVDNMGGLTINVPIDESMADIVSGELQEFPAGEQTLDGKQALVFARERHAYEWLYDGNLQEAYRQTNDRYILRTMIEQILSDPDATGELTQKLLAHIETDWDEREIIALAEDFAANKKKLEVLRGTGPYEGEIDYETNLWLAYRDEEKWAEVIDVVDDGGDPSEVIPVVSAYDE